MANKRNSWWTSSSVIGTLGGRSCIIVKSRPNFDRSIANCCLKSSYLQLQQNWTISRSIDSFGMSVGCPGRSPLSKLKQTGSHHRLWRYASFTFEQWILFLLVYVKAAFMWKTFRCRAHSTAGELHYFTVWFFQWKRSKCYKKLRFLYCLLWTCQWRTLNLYLNSTS